MKTLMLSAALLLGFSAAQERDNPEYQQWASFKVGSWVRFKSELEVNGTKVAIPTIMTATLLELDDKQAVVEQVVSTEIQGAAPEKPKKKTYPAKTKRKETIEKEGDEEIEVAGKKLTCHWIEVKQGAAGGSRTWTHADVPGGTVRLDILIGADKGRIQRLYAMTWEKK